VLFRGAILLEIESAPLSEDEDDYAAMHLFTMARRNGRTSVYCYRSFFKRFETLLAEMPRQHLFFMPFSPGPGLSNYGILCFTV